MAVFTAASEGGPGMVLPTHDNHVLYGDFNKKYRTFVRGEGVYVFDEAGNRYLDAIGGVGVVNIGHGVQEVVDIIAKQAQTLAFTYGGLVDNLPRRALARALHEWAPSGMGETRTFFCSGGAEANEAALKIAYQHHWERGHRSKQKIVGRWQSYHGNTVGALSMSGRTHWRRMHSPYLLNFPHISPPYSYRSKTAGKCDTECAYELERVIRQEGPENIAAFIAEPVIGTSMSAIVPSAEYYRIIRELCDEYDVLFIVDEVMSGIGRTGKRWGIEHWQVTPDIITTGKGISGGYSPLGAVILSEKVWKPIAQGTGTVMHSYTYGGNPLSCAAGVAVLNYIDRHGLIARAEKTGDRLLTLLKEKLGDLPCVGDVRGLGLFIGVELVADKATKDPFPANFDVTSRIEEEACNNGLLILGGVPGLIDGTIGDHFELLPPYVIDDGHVAFIVDALRTSIVRVIERLPKLPLPELRGRQYRAASR